LRLRAVKITVASKMACFLSSSLGSSRSLGLDCGRGRRGIYFLFHNCSTSSGRLKRTNCSPCTLRPSVVSFLLPLLVFMAMKPSVFLLGAPNGLENGGVASPFSQSKGCHSYWCQCRSGAFPICGVQSARGLDRTYR